MQGEPRSVRGLWTKDFIIRIPRGLSGPSPPCLERSDHDSGGIDCDPGLFKLPLALGPTMFCVDPTIIIGSFSGSVPTVSDRDDSALNMETFLLGQPEPTNVTVDDVDLN